MEQTPTRSGESWRRTVLVAVVSLAYIPAFYSLLPSFGSGVTALAVVPVALAGWFFGLWVGLLVGLLAIPLNILLLNLSGEPGAELVLTGGGGAGFAILVMTGVVLGRLSDLGRRLRQELGQRQRAEAKLQKGREELEQRVEERTSELQMANQLMRESEERYRNLVEGSPISVLVHSEERVVYVNARAIEILGGDSPEDFVGKSFWDFTHPDSRDIIRKRVDAIYQERRVAETIEARFQRLGGEAIDVEVMGSPTSYMGKPASQVVFLDISERKRAEEALQLTRFSVDRAADAIYWIDPQGRFLDVNQAASHTLGYSRDELLGMTIHDIDPSMPPDAWPARWEELRQRAAFTFETQHETKAGQFFPVEVSVNYLKFNEREYDCAFARDITERKQAEKQLQRRDSILEAVGFAAERFLRASSWEEEIEEVMARLGQAADVNRVYIFENGTDQVGELLAGLRYGWVAPGIESQLEDPELQDIPFQASGFARWEAALSQGQPIHGNVKEFPQSERQLLTAQDIQSIVVVPVYVEEIWWGFLGFDVCDEEREWARPEVEALTVAAGSFGAAIQRTRAGKTIRRQLSHLAALRSIDQAITASMDLKMTLQIFLDQVLTQLGVDAADVLLLEPQGHELSFASGKGFSTNTLQHTHLRLGQGYAGRAALERRTIHISDLRGRETDFLRSPSFSQEQFVLYYGVPLISKGQVKGVLEIFHREPLDPDGEWLDFMETLAGQAAIAVDNATLFEGLQRSNVELVLAYDATLEGWSRALELRDDETEGHSQRVTEMTMRLAREMGLDQTELVHVRRGALLHDIGKIGIPDSILLKPGPLTGEEWEIMRQHPAYAYEMLTPITYLRAALDIPYCHHEKWDGSGYPRGLKGDQIPLAARIFAVVDVWDALTSDRPYRDAWPEKRVLAHIQEQSRKHFDPQVVETFVKLRNAGGAKR